MMKKKKYIYNRLAKRQGLSIDTTLDPLLSWLENTFKILFRTETAAYFFEIVNPTIIMTSLQCCTKVQRPKRLCFSFYSSLLFYAFVPCTSIEFYSAHTGIFIQFSDRLQVL
jgi:hypothetical protein